MMQNRAFRNVPGAEAFIKAHAKNMDPNDPKMKEGCVICMEDFADNSEKRVAELHCKHIFHEECLKEWVKKNTTCPTCRAPIKNEDAEECPFD